MDPLLLPIRGHAKEISEAVRSNSVVVVIGETGSGKTTQIAQILEEAGLAGGRCICVTQPRRVAAVSVARRVASEKDAELGEEVGYAVRFEERYSRRTKIKFVTDGTLLRELLDDPELRQYGVVVLDEAHERSLNTDILFGVLKELAGRRDPPLKLVITSATLDGQKFCEYFNDCPLFNVSGRCFPVEVIHSTENYTGSQDKYLDAAVQTAMDVHCNQPEGDILVFLTGQAEIDKACRRLTDLVCEMPEGACGELLVLPLYAALPPDQQARVFVPAPEGCRRCIIATNIAETSITVDGVVYVIDSGVVKAKEYDPSTGMEALQVGPISRVQATQRSGRAGRTRPGKCFRLYTRKYYDMEMPNITTPEIQRTCLAGTILYLKTLPLEIDVLGFDYLDRPDESALQDALRQLFILDAIDKDGRITAVGRAMSSMPLEPSLARAVLRSVDLKCTGEMVIVAAMLAAEHIFAPRKGPGDSQRRAADQGAPGMGREPPGPTPRLRGLIEEGLGDHILLLRVFLQWDAAGGQPRVAQELGLDRRGMKFAKDVRRQLEGALSSSLKKLAGGRGGHGSNNSQAPSGRNLDAASLLRVNNPPDVHRVRKAILCGYANNLARRMQAHNGYRTINDNSKLAHLHPSSSFLSSDEDGLLPEWIVYHEFITTSRPFLSKVCPVNGEWTEDVIPKLRGVDVLRLSGGKTGAQAAAAAEERSKRAPEDGGQGAKGTRRNDEAAVNAARARFLARKKLKKG